MKETISYVTFSRWSVDALGRITNLKLLEGGELVDTDGSMFEWAADKLVNDWCILIAMSLLCLIISTVVLRRISKDSR